MRMIIYPKLPYSPCKYWSIIFIDNTSIFSY